MVESLSKRYLRVLFPKPLHRESSPRRDCLQVAADPAREFMRPSPSIRSVNL
jgi:hypothetical protein